MDVGEEKGVNYVVISPSPYRTSSTSERPAAGAAARDASPRAARGEGARLLLCEAEEPASIGAVGRLVY